ncbi:hypothetical protein VCBJG01_3412, partial [Vibrio cholerae BJG-01]
MLLASRET